MDGFCCRLQVLSFSTKEAEEELASGRVQSWDYTVCEKSRNEQWAGEGPQVNKVKTAQQFFH